MPTNNYVTYPFTPMISFKGLVIPPGNLLNLDIGVTITNNRSVPIEIEWLFTEEIGAISKLKIKAKALQEPPKEEVGR